MGLHLRQRQRAAVDGDVVERAVELAALAPEIPAYKEAVVVELHALGAVEPLAEDDRNPVLGEHRPQELFGVRRVRSLAAALGEARDQGATVVGLDPHAPVALRDVDLRGRVVLVIGSEHEGLGRAIRRACAVLAHLVEPGRIESLNASVAAGVALYELTIQRVKSGS